MTFGPLVDAGWLREHLGDADVRVIDLRWYLQGRDGREEYMRGHIPGSVFVDLEAVTGKEGGGRHPLPDAAGFEAAMRLAGVGAATRVVAYDDQAGAVAARLWFLLGYFGHRAQAVLDGGMAAWEGPLETTVPHVAPGDFVRSCKLLVDLLKQIEDVAPEPASELAHEARTVVNRGVVAYTGV